MFYCSVQVLFEIFQHHINLVQDVLSGALKSGSESFSQKSTSVLLITQGLVKAVCVNLDQNPLIGRSGERHVQSLTKH